MSRPTPLTPTLEGYLQSMTPQRLRRTLYDSEGSLVEARRYLSDSQVEAHEHLISHIRRIAVERGIAVKAGQ